MRPSREERRLGEPFPELAAELWLLTYSDLRETARIRAFLDFVLDFVRRGGGARSRLAVREWV